jgi:hypothetical protein
MTVYYFNTPFAISGDTVTIPQPVQVDGSISYTQGYGPDYQLTLGTTGALPPLRTEFNELMFNVTSAIQQLQQFGTPQFITAAQNLGVPYPYALNAKVLQTDGNVYQSLTNSNTTTPPSSSWINVSKMTPAILQNQYYTYAVDSGAVNAYVVALNLTTTTLIPGFKFDVLITHTNTSASTVTINGSSAYAIKKEVANGLAALNGNELVNNNIYTFEFDGTQVQVLNPSVQPSYSCAVYETTPTSIGGGSGNLVTWDTVDFTDPYSVVTFTGSPTYKMTANLTGRYLMSVNTGLAATGFTGALTVILYKNGTSFKFLTSEVFSNQNITESTTMTLNLAAGDYLQIYMQQNSGSNINTFVSAGSTFFQLTYLGN